MQPFRILPHFCGIFFLRAASGAMPRCLKRHSTARARRICTFLTPSGCAELRWPAHPTWPFGSPASAAGMCPARRVSRAYPRASGETDARGFSLLLFLFFVLPCALSTQPTGARQYCAAVFRGDQCSPFRSECDGAVFDLRRPSRLPRRVGRWKSSGGGEGSSAPI